MRRLVTLVALGVLITSGANANPKPVKVQRHILRGGPAGDPPSVFIGALGLEDGRPVRLQCQQGQPVALYRVGVDAPVETVEAYDIGGGFVFGPGVSGESYFVVAPRVTERSARGRRLICRRAISPTFLWP